MSCVPFAQSQWATYREKFPVEAAKNAEQVCLNMGGLWVSLAHTCFQGEQWEDIFFGEDIWSDKTHIYVFNFDGKEIFSPTYFWEMIHLFQQIKAQRSFLGSCSWRGTPWDTNMYVETLLRGISGEPALCTSSEWSWIVFSHGTDANIPKSHASFRVVI